MNVSKNPAYKRRGEIAAMRNCVDETRAIIAAVALELNRLFPKEFYPKKIKEWVEKLDETSDEMSEYENDGVFEYRVDKLMSGIKGFTYTDCTDIVRAHLSRSQGIFAKAFLDELPIIDDMAKNVQCALLQTCYKFGVGERRIKLLVDSLKTAKYDDPIGRLSALGADIDFELTEYEAERMFHNPRKRIDMAEVENVRRELGALKAYQQEVMKS